MDRPIAESPTTVADPDLKLIRIHEVMAICGKSRSSVYECIKNGAFPAPVKLGGRSSGWVKSEILQWADACIKATRSGN